MKIFISVVAVFISFTIFSAEMKIIGPCTPEPLITKTIVIKDLKTNLGNITVDYFTSAKIPFTGNEFGISSIYNSAVGDDALEVLSDTEMRAYGWCFTLNNQLIDRMPNDVYLSSKQDSIVWFYAFSSYKSGNWNDYCTPAYTLKPAIFCSKK
jgi:hypothetical protein